MLGATFDQHERSHAIGIWAALRADRRSRARLGGWLVDQVSWRAIFLLNVPLRWPRPVLAELFCLREPRSPSKRLDWAGGRGRVGLAAITWGLGAIPASGFHDAPVIAALEREPPFLIGFIAIEARFHERAIDAAVAVLPAQFLRHQCADAAALLRARGALYYLPFGLIRSVAIPRRRPVRHCCRSP